MCRVSGAIKLPTAAKQPQKDIAVNVMAANEQTAAMVHAQKVEEKVRIQKA